MVVIMMESLRDYARLVKSTRRTIALQTRRG
jgi:hypothetical protein